MKKVLIDTDVGSDIDDAFALILVQKSEFVQLAGVTTGYRNAERRARFAKTLLSQYGGKSVPVGAGIDFPLLQVPEKTEPAWAEQNYGADGKYLPPQCLEQFIVKSCDRLDGIMMMIEMLRSDPEMEILTIGPATNLAVAIRLAPDIVKNRTCTMMAGCLKKLVLNEHESEQYVAEWNVLADPEAMQIVISSGLKIRMVGLDVTLACALPKILEQQLLTGEHAVLFKQLLQLWKKSFRTDKQPILYDPVAAAAVINPSLFRFEKHQLKVRLHGMHRGVLFEDRENGVWIDVATQLNQDGFFDLFKKTLLA